MVRRSQKAASTKNTVAKATEQLLTEVHQLVLEHSDLQFNKTEICNNFAFAIHRMDIIDRVTFMQFAQSDLINLGTALRAIALKIQEYFSGTLSTSLQKMKAAEDFILARSADCKDCIHNLYTHENMKQGYCLTISCPHMAALWCDRLGNVDSAACGEFEKEIATILEAGVFGFPLQSATAIRIARLLSQDCDGCLSENKEQKSGFVTPEEVQTVMGGADLAEFLDTYYALAEPNYTALRNLYQSTAGDKWSKSKLWLQCEDMNQWHGLTAEGDKIKEVNLFNNKLKGALPAAFCKLGDVIYINLAMNSIIGKIPENIGQLHRLVELSLDKNKLVGKIPDGIGLCKSLKKLSLRQNKMSGEIPPALQGCESLEVLTLTENKFTGSVPAEFRHLTNLQSIRLDQNQLSGSIPPELVECSQLTSIDLSFNSFSGGFDCLTKLAGLKRLDLRWNKFTGPIPPDFGACAKLRWVGLSNNRIEGSLPESVSAMSKLNGFFAWKNRFTGRIPKGFGACLELEDLQLQNNFLEGDVPEAVFALPRLRKLWVQKNGLRVSAEAEARMDELQHRGVSVQCSPPQKSSASAAVAAAFGSHVKVPPAPAETPAPLPEPESEQSKPSL